MGSTGRTDCEPGPVPDCAAPCPLADLYHAHHRSLLRLATLLTGDASTAETVVVDSFVALHGLRKNQRAGDAVPYLRRRVVARSRSAARHHRRPGGERSQATGRSGAGGGQPMSSESLAVLAALRALPLGQREAIVLTFHLDLTEEQAAAAMQVSPGALRRNLAAAKVTLRAALSAEP